MSYVLPSFSTLIVPYIIGILIFLGKFEITCMSTDKQNLTMADVKLNKLQRMPEKMSQL